MERSRGDNASDATRRGRAARAAIGAGLLAATVLASVVTGATAEQVGASNATPRPAGSRSPAPFAATAAGPFGRIKHVIVFYQENHSFDETLGQFCKEHHNRCDGYVGDVKLSNGVVAPMTKSSDIVPSVWHNVIAQQHAINNGKMDGWNNIPGCNPPQWPRGCLTYFTPEQIPNLTALAAKYVVSDRTFSMYDSPSWGGHIYAAAATQDNFTGDIPRPAAGVPRRPGWGCDSNLVAVWINPKTGRKSMEPSCIPARPGTLDPKKHPNNGAFRPTQVPWVPTIFDRLDAKHLPWRLYSSTNVWSICPSFAECRYTSQRDNLVPTTQFLADARDGKLPAYSVLLPEGPGGATDQHNGGSMRAGDNWIGKAMDALQHSRDWSSTAVFITYDDCGCFYDHVRPGTNPDGSPQGIRVPMVIMSPYAKVGGTDKHPATFASILKFAEEAFHLPALTVNDRRAYDYRGSFDFTAPPTGPRAALAAHAVPAASRRYLATHASDPDEENDPT